jgi:CheY-like chemotaxis protein
MLKFLIIDDNASNRKVIKHFLASRDSAIVCHKAVNPSEAIKLMKKNNYDLVFLDMCLIRNIQDGVGILTWMKNNNKHFRTVVVSKLSDSTQVIRACESAEFVRLRIEHSQLHDFADLIDNLLFSENSDRLPSLQTRIKVSITGITLATICAIISLSITTFFYGTENPKQSIYIGTIVILIIFASICGLINIFGYSVVEKGFSIFKEFKASSLKKIQGQ